MAQIAIRPSEPGDEPALAVLYPAAFPAEDLVPLVRALLREPDAVRSLLAVGDSGLIGHVMITSCGLEGRLDTVALLGPLAVAPDHQRQGIGGGLVRAVLADAATTGAVAVLVLGNPAYYGRFGFARERGVEPPYPLPAAVADAWQSLPLTDARVATRGRLVVPSPWRQPALWGP